MWSVHWRGVATALAVTLRVAGLPAVLPEKAPMAFMSQMLTLAWVCMHCA